MKLRLEKLGYSRNPWRLVDENGAEMSRLVPFDHPTLGKTFIEKSFGYETKSAAIEGLCELVVTLAEKLKTTRGGAA